MPSTALRVAPVLLIVLGVAGVCALPAGAAPAQARPDSYVVRNGATLVVGGSGVLANDRGDLTTVVAHTRPAHGTLDLQPDGSFRYSADRNFAGQDTFTYTTSDAVDLYRTNLPALATIGGVKITGGGYGSSLTKVPGSRDYYGLTDRGPNVDGPDGSKVEPLPDFTPAIGRFRLEHGTAHLVSRIPLRAADGTPYNGRVNCTASTGETIYDLSGATLPCSPTGYDPEGLVALPDGTFWVSDEYGPLVTHFDAAGRQLARLSPFDGSLPRELANRVPNRGMEGLTITPDGRTLVGIMQSALQQPDLTKNPKNVAPIRIVTYDLRTHATHEYLYLLEDPGDTGTAASEITALSATEFVVDERDGKVEPGAYKKLVRVDVAHATDVGPATTAGPYVASKGGLLLGGKTVEALAGKDDTATVRQRLAGAGVQAGSTSSYLDVGALVTRLDPSGGFFGHDKVEGVAVRGHHVVISNDNDFGIDGLGNDAPPFTLHAKTLPDGTQDDGELLVVDTTRVEHAPTTATVTITVKPSR